MLNIKYVCDHVDEVKENLRKRRFNIDSIDKVISLNSDRKKITSKENDLRAEVKNLSKEIGPIKQKGENADELMKKVAEKKEEIAAISTKLEAIEVEQKYLLSRIPNLISEDVPVGDSEEDNKELSVWGEPFEYNFEVKDHVSLGENLGMLDFEKAAEVTGARFVFYKKHLARLERALINFMLDFHLDNEYTEIIPPFIVHERALYGTGQLPKFSEDLFKLENTDWYLIPTAEVPLTNLKRDELFSYTELPLKFVAYTPCFRSEAGSYGQDTRGIIRQHQFNKVEMVNIVSETESEKAFKMMVKSATNILELLELPYRQVLLCSTDIGFGARKTIDLEVWIPSQNKYREISSISNCWDFQSRRASIRYRNKEGKPTFAHTLNGSGLAVGRTLVAILENYQQEDGSIVIPEKLRPYMGGMELITK